MKPTDVKSSKYIGFYIQDNNKDPKLVIMCEYKNKYIFLPKPTLQVEQKNFSLLKKLRILYHGHMLLMILTVKKLLHHFKKKE